MLSLEDTKLIDSMIRDAIGQHYMVQKNWEKQHLGFHEDLSETLSQLGRVVQTALPLTSKTDPDLDD